MRTFLLLDAFGAHGLKDQLSVEMMGVFQTGVHYQMLHSLALVLISLLVDRIPGVRVSGWLFAAGIVVFSGSLYALAITGQRWFGAITPIGGVCFLVGWASIAVAAYRHKS